MFPGTSAGGPHKKQRERQQVRCLFSVHIAVVVWTKDQPQAGKDDFVTHLTGYDQNVP